VVQEFYETMHFRVDLSTTLASPSNCNGQSQTGLPAASAKHWIAAIEQGICPRSTSETFFDLTLALDQGLRAIDDFGERHEALSVEHDKPDNASGKW
jgi:hypothetical protein